MPNVDPSLTLDQAKAVVATKTAPRITEEFIKSRIVATEYQQNNHLTVCALTCDNGFVVLGHSVPADPRNYDSEVGKRYAYDNAFKKLWQLFGWRLRDAISGGVPGIGQQKWVSALPSHDETLVKE